MSNAEAVANEVKTRRVIGIKPVVTRSSEESRRRKLESEVSMLIEQLPLLSDDDWARIQFMLNTDGSLFHHAQVAKARAILGVLGPARNTAAWTAQDDYLAYDLYLATYREALEYLMRAEWLLGHLEESEYPVFEAYDLDKVSRLEIYLSWLQRRFGQGA